MTARPRGEQPFVFQVRISNNHLHNNLRADLSTMGSPPSSFFFLVFWFLS
jgi:hypothetical protein